MNRRESYEISGNSLEVADVNHYDSMVFVRFVDGRIAMLTGEQILAMAQPVQTDRAEIRSTPDLTHAPYLGAKNQA